MARRIHHIGIFRATAVATLGLVGLSIAPAFFHCKAQNQPSESIIAATLKRLRERPESLRSRAEMLRRSLERKRAYLSILNGRLSKARNETDDKLKAHQLSRYSYQVFLVSSRIAADEDKLRANEALLALIPRLGANEAPSLIKQELAKAAAARLDTSARLLREAESYRSAITEPTFKAQFERLITKTRAQIEAGKEQL